MPVGVGLPPLSRVVEVLLLVTVASRARGVEASAPATFAAPDGLRFVAVETIRAAAGSPVRVVHPDAGLRLSFTPAAALSAGQYELELVFPPAGLVDVVVEFTAEGNAVLSQRPVVVARNHFIGHFSIDRPFDRVTLIVTGSGVLEALAFRRFAPVHASEHLKLAARRGLQILRRDGLGVFRAGFNYLRRLAGSGGVAVSRAAVDVKGEEPYEHWIRVFDEAPDRDAAQHAQRLARLSRRPLISVLATLSSAEQAGSIATALSRQIYPAWELIVATGAAHRDAVALALTSAGADASRFRVVAAGANAVEAMNAALSAAQSAFILPLTEHDVLRPHALLEFALTLEQTPSARLVYADEDCIDASGRRSGGQFKPAWSPAWLAATNYLGSPVLLRRDTVADLGGWRAAATDPHHDLLLRVATAQPDAVVHLAKILVHRTSPRAPSVGAQPASPAATPPRVSIIIPTRDRAALLATCIRSIRARTRYPDYEIIIVDNGSVEDATKQLFAALGADPAIRVVRRPEPFNFSRLNNAAVREATGTVLAFVNNDIEVVHDGWLEEMVALALRAETGCVGAKLLYGDGRIQHAGIVIGLGGVAGHGHRFARADDPGYLGQLQVAHEVSAVTAACLVIRRAVFEAVGGFDETLAVAFNDVDFCLKVRAAGYRNIWTPLAELIHHESVSRGRDLMPAKARRFAAEHATVQRRWGRALLDDPYYSPHLTREREDFSLRLR